MTLDGGSVELIETEKPVHPGQYKPTWTDEEIATVKRMWHEGKSGTDIGLVLNRTRGMVLGCISRNGWQRRPPPAVSLAPLKTGPKPPPKPSVALRAGYPIAAKAPVLQALPALFKPLVALADNECRFPVTKDSPHLFCGQPKRSGSSYCAHHAQKAAAEPGLASYWVKQSKVGKFW